MPYITPPHQTSQ